MKDFNNSLAQALISVASIQERVLTNDPQFPGEGTVRASIKEEIKLLRKALKAKPIEIDFKAEAYWSSFMRSVINLSHSSGMSEVVGGLKPEKLVGFLVAASPVDDAVLWERERERRLTQGYELAAFTKVRALDEATYELVLGPIRLNWYRSSLVITDKKTFAALNAMGEEEQIATYIWADALRSALNGAVAVALMRG